MDRSETTLVLVLFILLSGNVIWAFLSKNRLTLFSPIIFITLIFFIYTVAGPLVFLNNDLDIFPQNFIRPFFAKAWTGSIISMVCITLGYYIPIFKPQLHIRRNENFNIQKIFILGFILSCFGLFLYGLANPGRVLAQINPLNVSYYQEERVLSGLPNYLSSSINFVIPGLCLMLLSIKKNIISIRNVIFYMILLISFFLFVSIGFRYRILVLFISMVACYYLQKQRVPSILISLAAIILGILFIGIIGETRSYGSGLQLKRLVGTQSKDLLVYGFRDANIFPISGAVMSAVPSKVDYVGMDIIKNAIIFPIPRIILPNKDTDSYTRNPIKAYKKLKAVGAHRWAAMLFFAEWYIAFGWFGIIGISFLLGVAYKNLWNWVIHELHNPLKIVIYSVSLSLLYIFISRGYLPFTVMSFFFIVFPALLANKLYYIKF